MQTVPIEVLRLFYITYITVGSGESEEKLNVKTEITKEDFSENKTEVKEEDVKPEVETEVSDDTVVGITYHDNALLLQ